MAGPLASGDGAVVVWDVPDEATLREHLAEDPYYAAPSVSEVSLREWDTSPL